jgi:hypothetical protein
MIIFSKVVPYLQILALKDKPTLMIWNLCPKNGCRTKFCKYLPRWKWDNLPVTRIEPTQKIFRRMSTFTSRQCRNTWPARRTTNSWPCSTRCSTRTLPRAEMCRPGGTNVIKLFFSSSLMLHIYQQYCLFLASLSPRGRCYKHFYGRNLRNFVISYSVCPRKVFPS